MSDFATPTLTLNDANTLPRLGFGTFKIAPESACETVRTALDVGYELVDTAAIYENERGVGEALAGRDDIFLTTKIWNAHHGYREAREAFSASMDRLGKNVLDLLLIHWPCPDKGLFVETWKACIDLRELGKVRSIGVSNFRRAELESIIAETGVKPALNQVELHPSFQQRELRAFHEDQGILTQSWSPLGQGEALAAGPIADIARETGQPASAVVLAWHLHHGLAPIPKASSREHMEANLAATKITLTAEQVAAIDALDAEDGRMGPDPATFC